MADGGYTTVYNKEELATAPGQIIQCQAALDEEVTAMMRDAKAALESWGGMDEQSWHAYQVKFNNDLVKMNEILGQGAAPALQKALENYNDNEIMGMKMWAM